MKLPRYSIQVSQNWTPTLREQATDSTKRRAVALAKQLARNGFPLVQVWQRTYRFGGTEERLVAEYSGPPVRSLRTFSHLRFKPHASLPIPGLTRAEMFFENGYGISVVHGPGSYSGKDTFEAHILEPDGSVYRLKDKTPPHQGWLSKQQVTEMMAQIQELPIA